MKGEIYSKVREQPTRRTVSSIRYCSSRTTLNIRVEQRLTYLVLLTVYIKSRKLGQVRFNPDPSEHNIYRTITISGLPLNITISMLLEKVQGGLVVDTKLLNIKEITGSKTALITFFHKYSALTYKEYTESYPHLFNNPSVEVKTLSTPT